MKEPNPIFMIFFVIVFFVAWITAVVSWVRMVTAKDRKSYVKNILLFVGPILLVFGLAHVGGIFHPFDLKSITPSTPPDFGNIFGAMPPLQKILLIIAGATWIVGGNMLFIFHNRRTNKGWWQQLNPLSPPFKDFNKKEWLILLGLVVTSMAFGIAALSQSQHPPDKSLNKSSHSAN